MKCFLICITVAISFAVLIDAHGMMVKPAGRGSLWRTDPSAITNYNDNEAFCGGYGIQWHVNKGKCGICGDDYRDETPRDHELGGTYGEGVIVNTFKSGETIEVAINITASHLGTFKWDLCNLDNENETEECFKNQVKLADGNEFYKLESSDSNIYKMNVVIPSDVKCEHCVFRWIYRTGNSWGWCENGTGGLGCGPQEHFINCADIAIQ